MRIPMLAALLAAGLYGQSSPYQMWVAIPAQTFLVSQSQDQTPPAQPAQTQPAQPDPQLQLHELAPDQLKRHWTLQLQQVGGGTPPKFQVRVNTPATCAIPLLNLGNAQNFKGDPKIVIPHSGDASNSPGTVQTMPVCGKP